MANPTMRTLFDGDHYPVIAMLYQYQHVRVLDTHGLSTIYDGMCPEFLQMNVMICGIFALN